jgi:hypothetical protein
MFLPEARFHDSGHLVSSVSHLERLVSLPPGYAPRTVLIGNDSQWLAHDSLTDAAIAAQPIQADTTLSHLSNRCSLIRRPPHGNPAYPIQRHVIQLSGVLAEGCQRTPEL